MLAQSVDTEPTGASENWTPEQQIAHMLDLCEAQMESALSESDQAVESLIKAFTGLADTTRSVSELADKLPPDLKEITVTGLNQQVDTISKQMAAAIVAFQFYDKLTQRLGHVRYSLTTLAMFVCDRAQTSQKDQWRRLFTTLQRLYRTEEERKIFQMMVEGASAEEARAFVQQTTQSIRPAATGDIELF
jgi:SOS response regulatory protein OraA/RecX